MSEADKAIDEFRSRRRRFNRFVFWVLAAGLTMDVMVVGLLAIRYCGGR